MEVTLGKTYKDSISGYEGVAVSRATYLYGCVRVLLSPTSLKKDGDFLPDAWFDEPQLISVRAKKSINTKKTKKVTGGPSRSTPTSKDPF